MKLIRALDVTGANAWDARSLTTFSGSTTARIHWTDQPYHWHTNDGVEVFTVLAGTVRMHHRDVAGHEAFDDLEVGDTFVAEEGDQHYAEPLGEARVLVVEREGSE